MLRCENLVSFLRRNIVKNVFTLCIVKIIRQSYLECQKFLDRVIKYYMIKQLSGIVLFFSGFSIDIRATVTKQAELIERDACDFKENLVRNNHIKCLKSGRIIAVCHKEGRNRSCKATQMVTHSILNRFFGTLTLLCFDCFYDLFAQCRNGFLQNSANTFLEGIRSFLHQCVKMVIDLGGRLSCFVEMFKYILSFCFESFLLNRVVSVFLSNEFVSFLFKLLFKFFRIFGFQICSISVICHLHHWSD